MPDFPEGVPENAQVARFTRITSRIGFASGAEETVAYDERVVVDDDETHFRQFTERNADEPLHGGQFDLRDDVPQRTVLRVFGYPRETIEYRRFVESEQLYLVTYDAGRSIRILQPDEVPDWATGGGRQVAREPAYDEEEYETAEVGEWDESDVDEDAETVEA